MSVESTRETMTRYFNSEHGDVSMMAEDVVFTIMATGQEHHGRDGVMGCPASSRRGYLPASLDLATRSATSCGWKSRTTR